MGCLYIGTSERVGTSVRAARWRDCRFRGQGARGEARASNIRSMFVTRDVSQRSRWLKAVANCAEGRKQGHTVRGELRGARIVPGSECDCRSGRART